MAIYITGDTHGEFDFRKLTTEYFPEGANLTKSDYVIICGDFGGVWDAAGYDKYVQNLFSSMPWTTLFIDGNHENFDALAQYSVEEWNGGKVQFIRSDIIHLMRGQVYTIDGHTIFTMGGATSIDKYHRTEGLDWWPQEIPTMEEFEEGFRNLEAHNNKVDLIVSHAAPTELHKIITYYAGSNDDVINYLEIVRQTIEFDQWYFGHYHKDIDYGRYCAIYKDVKRIW